MFYTFPVASAKRRPRAASDPPDDDPPQIAQMPADSGVRLRNLRNLRPVERGGP